MLGRDVDPEAGAYFDPVTGKPYIPFERATKVKSGEQLVYSVHLYVMTIQTLKHEAPKVSFDFVRDVTRVSVRGRADACGSKRQHAPDRTRQLQMRSSRRRGQSRQA